MTASATEPDKALETVEVSKVYLEEILEKTAKQNYQQFVVVPKNFEETAQYAKWIRQSQTCPRTKDGPWSEADIFIAIETGKELNIPPLVALSGTAIINGRATIWGDLALALVLRSGLVEEWHERPAKEALAKGQGYFRIKRKGNKTATEVYFDVEDAKRAGLWGKSGPWTNYPGRMLQMRPRSWALRDAFADVLKGIAIAEEIRDYPNTEAVIQETLRRPQRIDAPTAEAEVPLVAPDTGPVTEDPGIPEDAAPETAPAPSTQGIPDDQTAGELVAVIANVETIPYDKKDRKTKVPTGERGNWYKVTAEGVPNAFATFSDTHADIAGSCGVQKAKARIRWSRTPGKPNLKIEAIEPA